MHADYLSNTVYGPSKSCSSYNRSWFFPWRCFGGNFCCTQQPLPRHRHLSRAIWIHSRGQAGAKYMGVIPHDCRTFWDNKSDQGGAYPTSASLYCSFLLLLLPGESGSNFSHTHWPDVVFYPPFLHYPASCFQLAKGA